jgi:hypothetical protein
VTTGPPPTHDPARTIEALLSQSWLLFRRNWIVALPPLIGAAVAVFTIAPLAVAIAFVVVHNAVHAPQVTSVPMWSIAVGVVVIFAVAAAVGLYSVAAPYGMADAAWSHGTTVLADGWMAFRRRSGALSTAGLAMLGVAIAALILALPTLGLSLFAFPLVTMYVVPSAVAGGRGGFAAIGESFRLVRRSPGRSAVLFLVGITISYLFGYVAEIGIAPMALSMIRLGAEPALQAPPLVLAVVGVFAGLATVLGGIALSGFYTIVLVGFYHWLVAESATAAAAER